MGNKLSAKQNIKPHNEDFIINHKHSQKNKTNDVNDMSRFDPRRKVFISLRGLYQSWQNVPSHVLYTSIFILPLKSEWIYSSVNQFIQLEACPVLLSSTFSDIAMVETFIKMLQWKDSQGLIIFMYDDYENKNDECENKKYDEMVRPVWYYINDKFNKMNLNKLNLDTNWWRNKLKNTKGDVKMKEILVEFWFVSMKFKAIKEIINQSNATLLHPIEHYSCDVVENRRKYKLCTLNDDNEIIIEDKYNDWWVSSEYDPYDPYDI